MSEDQDYYPRPGQALALSKSSVPAALTPASVDQFEVELLACLTLCAPAGMSEDHRVEWVEVARTTLADLPADLLSEGCAKAREKADHPSKIIPIIMETVGPAMKSRREIYHAVPIVPERQIEAKRPTAKQIADILRDTGFSDVAAKVENGERI